MSSGAPKKAANAIVRKARISQKRSRKAQANDLFVRADAMSDQGNLRSAFRLFLAAAELGDLGSQLNVGYCYAVGAGVKRNRAKAMEWYKRAYRRGDACAASNIGIIWRDERKFNRALEWFRRAVDLGDDDANLEIAKVYLRIEHDPRKAIPYLNKVCKSNCVTEATEEEAARLLKQAKKGIKRFVKPSQ